jgi:hypothetical protein
MKWLILLFVFTVPMHADPPGWYVDQSDGRGNCGPACAAMAVNKMLGLELKSADARRIIGYRVADGATFWTELRVILDKYEINNYYTPVPTLEKLINTVADYHTLVIILFDPRGLTPAEGGQTGRAYIYDSRSKHYVILDDYVDGYFLVQDPFPGGNYNRLYKATEVWSLMTKDIIIIYE